MSAANHIADLVFTPFDRPAEVDLEKVSHAKGMLSRCVRKDQWDWYTVYALLGKPPQKDLNEGRQSLSQLRDSAKEKNRTKVNQSITQLKVIGIAKRFAYFVRRINRGKEYGVIDEEYLLDKLHSMDPVAFEHFIADCWNQTGHSTRVVPDEDDLGVDVVATADHVFPRKYLIQVKCYSPDTSIGLSEVQRYSGLAQDENADSVYLITTADFTQNAQEWAEGKPIKLIDGFRLAELIRSQELEPIVDQYIE